jgi:chromosome segregation protein
MQLESIKLSGFKSFADKTVIEIRSHLNAIVGPNGCGKSNVVDAIRWVIGESSAKQLRSQSMADVIFNGTTKRSASGRARVELSFNNHLGRIAGPFADFDTIQIAREVTVDGQSNYSINQRNCRRKDILDLFSGTGMGSRSYSIIEQGMISRLIEAKPEDLRIFLEEACGISKYKDRRRETNTRMRHCEENLARVTDICEELATQHRRLSRQAKNAARYQELSNQEHTLKNQLLALKYDALMQEKEALEATLAEAETSNQTHHVDYEGLEEKYEHLLESQKTANEEQYDKQRQLYEVQSRIQSIEQTLSHQQQQKAWRQEHLERANKAYQDYQTMIEEQMAQAEELRESLAHLTPQLSQSELALTNTEEAVKEAQHLMEEKNQAWSAFLETQNTLTSKINLFEQKIKHLNYLLEQAMNRQEGLQSELAQMDLIALEQLVEQTDITYEQVQASQQELDDAIEANASAWQHLNEEQKLIQDQLSQARTDLQQTNGRLSSLEALQEAALNDDGSAVKDWLSERSLDQLTRLAQEVQVDEKWEHALEVVLADAMTGVCLAEGESLDFLNTQAPKGSITLLTQSSQSASAVSGHVTLADKVQTRYALPIDLSQIFLASDESEAKTIAATLPNHASVILADGRRFGRDWCQFTHKTDAKAGMLQRGREIAELEQALETFTDKVNNQAIAKDLLMAQIQACEEERAPLKARHQEMRQQLAQAMSEKTQAYSQLVAKKQRQQTIDQQVDQLIVEIGQHQTQLRECQQAESEAKQSLAQLEATQIQLSEEKAQAQAMIQQQSQDQASVKSAYQDMMMAKTRQEDQLQSLEQMIAKNRAELERAIQTRAELLQAEGDEEDNSGLIEQLESQQQTLAKQKELVEAAKHQLSALEVQLKEAHQDKQNAIDLVQRAQEKVSTLKLDLQSCLVKQSGVLESFEQQAKEEMAEKTAAEERKKEKALEAEKQQAEALQEGSSEEGEAASTDPVTEQFSGVVEAEVGQNLEDAVTESVEDTEEQASVMPIDFSAIAQETLRHWLQHLPEDKNVDACAEQLSQSARRIARLGPINLAAIEECQDVETRKNDLETQKNDLEEALATLRDAISDIDEACKSTLQETYDKVNTRFQEIFPNVFGGGKASLELMEDDILSTGILVRAQPPGKKVAAIHMLSGGEKALTAISLVFALFSLNPAPFCILDEVDAPLDDLNVERYCKLIEEMAKDTQFLVISHNKSTIAHMDHLIGVTMGEPGVSRIVSVDMEEAVSMLD